MGIVQLIIIIWSKTNKSTPIYFISLNREIYIVFIGDVAFIAHEDANKPNGCPTVWFVWQAIHSRWINYKSINWTYLFSLSKSLLGADPNRWSIHYIPNSRGGWFCCCFCWSLWSINRCVCSIGWSGLYDRLTGFPSWYCIQSDI